MAFIKKHFIFCTVLAIVLFLVIGTLAPFAVYSTISEKTIHDLEAMPFLQASSAEERAMILETSQSAWNERIRLMDRAEERIVLSTFDMREGRSTEDILSVMLHKADEGVKIQILVDGVSGFLQMEGSPLFYAVSSHPNIEVKIYNPINLLTPWKLQGRMHDKYIMVDHEAYILGGRNSFDYFIGDYDSYSKSLDREVLIYNTEPEKKGSMEELEAYFTSVWNMPVTKRFHDDLQLAEHPKVAERIEFLRNHYDQLKREHSELFHAYDYAEVTCPIEAVQLVSNPRHVYGKEPLVFCTVTELMKRAKEKVVIHTPYIVCNDYMYGRLAEVTAAVPDVKLVINSIENGDNLVASSDYLWNKPSVLDTGMSVYEYDGGTSSHGKSIVIDDEIAVIGSYNFDLRSTYMDTELMLVIKSKELTAQLEENLEHFERDCRYAVNATDYEVPDHVQVRTLSKTKHTMMRVIGLLLKPFRYVI